MIRKPYAAGSFYPRQKAPLEKMILSMLSDAGTQAWANSNTNAFVSPHAGISYSGKTAAFAYAAIASRLNKRDADTIIIIGPNHTGIGNAIALSKATWETPMGKFETDEEMAEDISHYSNRISLDEEAHHREHSIEVQLPFLAAVAPEKSLICICMGNQSYYNSELVAKAVLHAAEKNSREIIAIASSDLNHYEPAPVAKARDAPLINAIKAADPMVFYRSVEESGNSACGYGPITSAMLISKSMGSARGRILNYSNSGNSSAESGIGVVSYLSAAFTG
jgi:AmmeMemoRadiSam system protein B